MRSRHRSGPGRWTSRSAAGSGHLTSNAAQLVSQVLTGEVWPPLADRHAYRVGPDGQPFALPGMGGVTLGVHCGDPATGYASDHLEPGASVRHRDPAANMALQFLTCVGNPVRVETGPAAGAVGHVIGQHAYVLADLPEPVLAGHDRRCGHGHRLRAGPRARRARRDRGQELPPRAAGPDAGRHPAGRPAEVHVAARVPAEAIGAGVGMNSEYANTDLMGAYAGLGEDLSLGLEGLRIGDIVALADTDHRYGRGYREGYLTIGVISTGQCMLFGHGPGPSSLLSGPAEAFHLVDDPAANLSGWYHGELEAAVSKRSPGGGLARLRQPARRGRASRARRRPVPDRRGRPPYLPVGDGGIVLGLQLGDPVLARSADHAAPGACLVHPDPAARHALAIYSCIGNQVKVRTGRAAARAAW